MLKNYTSIFFLIITFLIICRCSTRKDIEQIQDNHLPEIISKTNIDTINTKLIDSTLSSLSFRDSILPIFAQHCIQCHSEFTVHANISQRANQIAAAIKKPNPMMPQKGEPLSDENILKINTWISNGKPNN